MSRLLPYYVDSRMVGGGNYPAKYVLLSDGNGRGMFARSGDVPGSYYNDYPYYVPNGSPYADISKTSWQTVNYFLYEGTNEWTLALIVWVVSAAGATSFDLRIVNDDTGLTVAQYNYTGSSSVPVRVSTSTISNLPTTLATFRFDVIKNSGQNGRLHFMRASN